MRSYETTGLLNGQTQQNTIYALPALTNTSLLNLRTRHGRLNEGNAPRAAKTDGDRNRRKLRNTAAAVRHQCGGVPRPNPSKSPSAVATTMPKPVDLNNFHCPLNIDPSKYHNACCRRSSLHRAQTPSRWIRRDSSSTSVTLAKA